MTAISDEELNSDKSNSSTVRTSTSNFSTEKPAKAEPEWTGGERKLNTEKGSKRFLKRSYREGKMLLSDLGKWAFYNVANPLTKKIFFKPVRKTVKLYEGDSLNSRFYKYYLSNILPKIEDRRGATRIKLILEKMALLNLDKISFNDGDYVSNPIFEEGYNDWDNLIILDGCRHDIYEDVRGESIGHRYTCSYATHGFIPSTFKDPELFEDVVCITGNPHYEESMFSKLTGFRPDNFFHSIYHTYKTDWSDKHSTVLPQTLCRDARTAEKLHSDKRKIIHFMQPHFPFVPDSLGDMDQDIRSDAGNIWVEVEKGKVDSEEVVEAYKKNLEYVLEFVDKLAQDLDGKTVVTADHGNLIGEGGLYGHHHDVAAPGLRKVPWEVIE